METLLKPGNVRPASFGKLWQTPLDGFVNGQPLYVSGLKINEKRYNVVIAATDTNSIYALDSETGKILWERKSVVPPVTGGQFNGAWNSREFHGILSTPVIDLPNHTLYTCLPHARGLKQVYEFWAIDIRNGSVKPGFPVEVKARDGKAVFKAGQCMQRGALTLEEGWVYAPFGGRGDVPPWRGWIIGINTRQPSAPQRAFCGSPVSDGAGIWSGGGISVSPNGDLFAVTGNGDYDFDKGGNNLGQSVIRLRNSSDKLAFSRTKRDIYTPRNFRFLDEQDEDLGGATALILPPLQNSSTPNLLFTGGKDGCAYLLNRDDLGGIGGELQRTRLFSQEDAPYHEGIRATPAYFDSGSNGRFLYVSGDQPGPDNNLGLMAVRLTTEGVGGPARFQKQWSHNRYMERPGAPVVSSNGQWDGIVWVTELGPDEDESQGSIQAFDALTGEMIYHSDQDTIRDRIGGTRKFVSPTVANGRVFVGIRGIACFGINVPEKGNE
ncbi:MAG: PQQ-binding-like beta-propeller repeat protein [Capsulimonadales bacterium]|nr:PQQ-binding-like beta-propeller repeat protein [Capsulimonadales bacterium]